jgi:hypothetical protein
MKNRSRVFSLLLPCSLTLACTTAQAEQEARIAASSFSPTCNSTYQVVGVVSGGVETESILGTVFTDSSPFECTLASSTQSVTFNFNASSTDLATGCEYDLVRETKVGEVVLDSAEVLDCNNVEIHYGVVAMPRVGDSDCNGLPRIVVDPKIKLNDHNCGGG